MSNNSHSNSNSNSNSGYNANNDEEGMGGAVQPKPYDKIIDSLDIVDLLISPLNSNSPKTPFAIVWGDMLKKMIKAETGFGAKMVPMILEGEILSLGLQRTPKIKLLLTMYWLYSLEDMVKDKIGFYMEYISASLQRALAAARRRRDGEEEEVVWPNIEMNNIIFPALDGAKMRLKDTLRRGEDTPVSPHRFDPLDMLASAIPSAIPSAAAGGAAGNEGPLRLILPDNAWARLAREQAKGERSLQSPPPLKKEKIKKAKIGERQGRR